MKTDNRLSRRIPASGVHNHKQPQWWLAPLSPFLTYINMRTLALLMFVSFAVLNTTHGNDGKTKQQVTGNIESQVISNVTWIVAPNKVDLLKVPTVLKAAVE